MFNQACMWQGRQISTPLSPLLHENTLTHLKKYFFIHYKLYEILQSQAVAMFLSFVDLVSLL